MTKRTENESNPAPSGFQPEVPQDADAPEEQKKTAASGAPDQAEDGQHGRPRDDEDDGHS